MYELMVAVGAVMSLAGLAGLILCIVRVRRARKAGLSDDELRAAVATVLPLNMGALGLSAIGLMLVAMGTILA